MNKKKGLRRFLTLDVHNHEGFTLVELIVVIAILGILAGVAVPTYSGYVKKANRAADEVLLSEINTAFQAACIENYTDASAINSAEWDKTNMTVKSVQGDAAHPIVASFGRYFDTTSEFKIIEDLIFNQSLHRFVEKTSNFDDEGVMNEIRLTLDGISGYFATGLANGLVGDDLKAWLTTGMNEDLIEGLGLNGMLDGYNAAMEYTDAELDEILSDKIDGYDGLSETEKNNYRLTYKSNLGVMYFAEDAAIRNPEDVMNSVGNFIDIMLAKDNAGSVTDEQLEAYYLATASAVDVASYNAASETRKQEIIDNFRTKEEVIGLSDDLKYTGAEAAAMALAAAGTENTAGVSMLGSMYALAAGYYNSDYYNAETDGTKPNSYGDFDSITKAMKNESFFTYIEAQGQADLEAYLEHMADLSRNPDVDLTSPNAFSGLNGQS